MAIAYFPSKAFEETVEVIFAKPDGGEVTMRLLVDSGFTGESSLVLPQYSDELAHSWIPGTQVAGAIQGIQRRMVVLCRISGLSFQMAAIAILADTASLALPPGIDGVVGLTFLRH